MKTKNFLLPSILVIVTALIVTCYKNKGDYNSTTTESKVSITSTGFSPASLTIVTGSTVSWTNNDNMVHTVTTAEGSINSGDIAPASTYTKTFSTAGTYNYYDAHNTNMKGVLIVTASSGGGGGY
jgi:plastocyanin